VCRVGDHAGTDVLGYGTTVLLTTQYLEEADQLADRIAVIDRGRVIARGTADELKDEIGGERLELVVASATDLQIVARVLSEVGSGEPTVDEHTRKVDVLVDGGTKALIEALRRLDAQGVVVQDIALHRPTLDDVFLSLTGHTSQEGEE
jgi:ABC-2 type transport system ATP-binding protein